MYLLKLLFYTLLDIRGDDEQEVVVEAGQGEAPIEGQGEAPSEKAQSQEEAQPKYGRFGEKPNVDEMFQALQELEGKHDGLTKKTGQTEKNLASLRKAAESTGLRVLQDSYGNVQLVPAKKETSSEKQRRFTAEHKTKLSKFFSGDDPSAAADEFLSILNLYLQDHSDDTISNYDKRILARQQFQRARDTSNDRMLKLYPQIDEENDSFDKSFFERATEIYHADYETHPQGELIAATQAAAEMGISPITLRKAEAKGFEKGKETKTILAPVGQGSKGKGSGKGFKELSKEEYLKLDDESREKYNKEKLQIK